MDYPIVIAEVPCPLWFPDFEAELAAIAGLTPTGEPRLGLEWGGTARRPFGRQWNAKFGLYSERVVTAWIFQGEADGPTPGDRTSYRWERSDWASAPEHMQFFSDGRPRMPVAEEALVDHPVPNWYLTDWLSPRQMGRAPKGIGYRGGYWNGIWRISDPDTDDHHPCFWGDAAECKAHIRYRHPDDADLLVAREYWHAKLHGLDTMGVHIDDPIEGSAAELQAGWMAAAAAHLEQEEIGQNVERGIAVLEKYFAARNSSREPKIIIDYGAHHGR